MGTRRVDDQECGAIASRQASETINSQLLHTFFVSFELTLPHIQISEQARLSFRNKKKFLE